MRELRNDISGVLRRVEAGERLVVTVDRRPVAALVPLARRRSWIPARKVWSRIAAARADPALAGELSGMLTDRIATQDDDFDDLPGVSVLKI